jgi:TonB family protein
MVVHDEPEPVEAEATPAPEAKQVDNRPEDAVPQESTRKADVNAKMDDLLAELDDADDGPRDRDASSPDGMVGAEPSRTVGPGTGDPELRAYIQRLEELFKKEFRPIIKGQNLTAKVLVAVDDTGTVKSARIDQSSGNPSFDRSAVAAAEAVPKVPPPPERYRDGTPRSYRIIFND